MDSSLRQELDMILYLMLENEASQQQIERLDALLESDPESLAYAMDYYLITAALRKSNAIPSASFNTQDEIDEQFNLLKVFAEEERIAPTVEIPVEEKEPPQTAAVRPAASKSDRQKTALWVLVGSMAALFLFFASIKFIPNREPVAMLAEVVEARWQNGEEGLKIQDLFYNTDIPRVLRSGTIEIEFNSGARAVLEGPAEFVCKSDNMISLSYGRLYSRVPRHATGFTVLARDARIVDLGTEFGVQANVDGTLELHVTDGKTSLIAGNKIKRDVYQILAGQARQVSDQGTSIKEIELKDSAFAQKIDTETGLVWKGQKALSLADLTGGGNGFGTGTLEAGIDPGTGKAILFGPELYDMHPVVSNAYRRVEGHPFVDGVFVPNSADRPQVISSQGHIFEDCPKTNGTYYTGIINGTVQEFGWGGPGLKLNGIVYGTANSPAIFIHANQGITFDLQMIRRALQGTPIMRFEAICGISQTAVLYGMADFYVLVDGQVRFHQGEIQKDQFCDVRVDLNGSDRFLTLVTVASPNKIVPEGLNMEHGDWCLFGNPNLVLE
jgi:hypothetical protein